MAHAVGDNLEPTDSSAKMNRAGKDWPKKLGVKEAWQWEEKMMISVYDKITLDCLWDIEMVASSRPLGTCVRSLIKRCEMQIQRPQC